MDLERLREMALALPGATEDVKWGNDLCFCIAEKMFCVTGLEGSPVGASLKVAKEDFDSLCARPGCKPAPYLARYHWVHIDDISRWSRAEWQDRLQAAYSLVREKLPAKIRRELPPV